MVVKRSQQVLRPTSTFEQETQRGVAGGTAGQGIPVPSSQPTGFPTLAPTQPTPATETTGKGEHGSSHGTERAAEGTPVPTHAPSPRPPWKVYHVSEGRKCAKGTLVTRVEECTIAGEKLDLERQRIDERHGRYLYAGTSIETGQAPFGCVSFLRRATLTKRGTTCDGSLSSPQRERPLVDFRLYETCRPRKSCPGLRRTADALSSAR